MSKETNSIKVSDLISLELKLGLQAFSDFLTYKIAPQADEFNKILHTIAVKYQPVLVEFQEFATKANEVLKIMDQKVTALRNELKREDLFLIPYLDRKFTWIEILKIFSDNSKSPLQIYDELFSSREHIDDILSSWNELEEFWPRLNILKAALYSHQNKKYILSIPILLSQIEGLCISKLGADDIKGKLREIKGATDFQHDLLGEEIFFNAVMEKIFVRFGQDASEWKHTFPSRQLIMHGKDLNYYKKEFASLRLILVIDYLTKIFRDIDYAKDELK